MCFSAPASFLSAAVAGVAGMAALSRVEKREEIPLAAIPILFGFQQAVEGLLWITLADNPSSGASAWLIPAFLFFALILWPVYAPFAALMVEPQPERRIAITACVIAGAIATAYFALALQADPRTAAIEAGHIVYSYDPNLPDSIRVLYPIATCLAPALSTPRSLRLFAVLIAIGSFAAFFAYWVAFTSVWCFFAAASSFVIVYHFEQAWQHRHAAAALRNT